MNPTWIVPLTRPETEQLIALGRVIEAAPR